MIAHGGVPLRAFVARAPARQQQTAQNWDAHARPAAAATTAVGRPQVAAAAAPAPAAAPAAAAAFMPLLLGTGRRSPATFPRCRAVPVDDGVQLATSHLAWVDDTDVVPSQAEAAAAAASSGGSSQTPVTGPLEGASLNGSDGATAMPALACKPDRQPSAMVADVNAGHQASSLSSQATSPRGLQHQPHQHQPQQQQRRR